MTFAAYQTSLMAALPINEMDAQNKAPTWIHVLPAPVDGKVTTNDGRGPYTLAPFAEIIANTFADTDAIEVDINHATFRAAPKGGEARAVGWIKQLQAREDGLWAHVDWTDEGEKLVGSKAYRSISPVVMHPSDTNLRILGLANVSLVNRPNFQGLTTLHQQETSVNFMQRMAKALGLKEEATEDEIMTAFEAKIEPSDTDDKVDDTIAAMQSAMANIGGALGVTGTDPAVILAAAQATATSDGTPALVASLQSQVVGLTAQLNAVTADRGSERANAFLDAELKRGNPIAVSMREHYVSMHMEDPERVEKELAAMPALTPSGLTMAPPPDKDGHVSLHAEQANVANMLGISTEDYTAQLEVERAQKEVL